MSNERCPECGNDLDTWDGAVLSDNPTGPLKTLCAKCGADVTDQIVKDFARE